MTTAGTTAAGGRPSAGALWRAEMFGGLRAIASGAAGLAPSPGIDRFQTYKTAALFARLAYPPCARHSREALAAELWPDAPADAARNRLTQALVWLRPRLEPFDGDGGGRAGRLVRGSVFATDRASVGLRPGAVGSDVADFSAALREADAGGAPASTRAALVRALSLYRGDLLPDLHEEWVLGERERLRGAYVATLRRLCALHEAAGEFEPALALARSAVAAEPLLEEAHCDLIRLLARSGQPAAALRQYRELERALADEYEETPSPEAVALAERVRRRDAGLLPPAGTAAGGPVGAAAPRLPVPFTRFFGRAAEVEGLLGLLRPGNDAPARLVTLIGPGGAGKTRLAIEAARVLAPEYEGETWFVPLADVPDPLLIPAAVATALRLPAGAAEALDQVVERLSWRRSLLLLDNLEQLAEAGGATAVLRGLLERCPSLSMLVTSRQRLGVDGEREVAVPPLSLPPAGDSATTGADALLGSEAVQLFVDRAQAVRPAFHLTPANAAAVAAICGRLDGIPLAIELCAAWAQTLTPAQILEQLGRPLDLLVSRRPGPEVEARHRSLRAALEYSYGRLPAELARTFRALSVFRGGWTLGAAAVVSGAAVRSDGEAADDGAAAPGPLDALEALTSLRERSLITADEPAYAEGRAGGAGMRYRMLGTVRDFAEERLREAAEGEEADRLRRAHAWFFLRLAEDAGAGPSGPEGEEALRLLEAEHDNLTAALAWAADTGEAGVGLRLAGALAPYWDARGHLGEGRHWLTRLLSLSAAPGVTERVRARALTALGHLSRNQGNSAEVDAAMSEALTLWRQLGDEHGVASCLQALATIAYSREGGMAAARTYLHDGLDLARRLGDPLLLARTLLNLGNVGLALGEWDGARAHYEEALALYRDAGSLGRVGTVLNNLGLIARYRGDADGALPFFEEAYRIGEERHNRAVMAVTTINRATARRLRGECGEGRALLFSAARWASQSGDRRLLPWCVREMGHLACAEGDYPQGVRLLAAAEAQRLAMGITFKPADPEELERAAGRARTALGESGFAAAWAVGSALPRARVYAESLRLPEG